MKKVVLFLMIFVVGALAQDETWGRQIVFGNVFTSTDSLKLVSVSITDTVLQDTLYSKAISIPGDGHEGIYGVAAYLDEVSGTSASIGLDVRFGVAFYDKTNTNVQWADWNNIWSCAKSTLYRKQIVPADSAWFIPPSDFRQYRLTEADDDTVLHNVSDYLR